jgi:hypothetical protein
LPFQVKCLHGGAQWIPEQLTMIQSLNSCGANSIWEYSLLNPATTSSSSLTSSSKVSWSSSLSNSSSGYYCFLQQCNNVILIPVSYKSLSFKKCIQRNIKFKFNWVCYFLNGSSKHILKSPAQFPYINPESGINTDFISSP